MYGGFGNADADTQSHNTLMSKLYFMCPCEQMKVTKTSRDACLPSSHSSSAVWAVTSSVEFNQEGHRVCLAHRKPDTLAFIPVLLNPILLFPFQISTEAAPSVKFSYGISCQGLESDQSGTVKRVRSTPRLLNRTKTLRSKPPSPGSCNGNGRLPLCTTSIWANPWVLQSRIASS